MDSSINDEDGRLSIEILRQETRDAISHLLNPPKSIPCDSGLLRDWRGLIDLCGLSGAIAAAIRDSQERTGKILTTWAEQQFNSATINNLLSYLQEMDRYDVIKDITPLIIEDITVYRKTPRVVTRPSLASDKDILTNDDVLKKDQGLPLEIYDAFVLYDQDDIDFATKLIDTMEKEYEMKFCVKDRDLVGGGLEHSKIIKSITERCNRLIVILSDAFFQSSANKYYLSFAQAYGIENERKMIPCLYKECTKWPPEMLGCFCLDYSRARTWDFWSRLYNSLRVAAPAEKSNLMRSQSENKYLHHNQSEHHETTTLKVDPKPLHQVKFHSESDLNGSTVGNGVCAENVTPGTSDDGQRTKKTNWIKRFLHIPKVTKDPNTLVTNKKKSLLSKHIRRKVPAMSN